MYVYIYIFYMYIYIYMAVSILCPGQQICFGGAPGHFFLINKNSVNHIHKYKSTNSRIRST